MAPWPWNATDDGGGSTAGAPDGSVVIATSGNASQSVSSASLWAWAAGVLTGSLATALYFVVRESRAVPPSTPSLRAVDIDEEPTSPRAGVGMPSLRHSSLTPKGEAIVDQLDAQFHISPAQLYNIMRQFVSEMERGLARDDASMKMIPTFVDRRPTGMEQGTFLALDLGGTNFRVVQVTLEGRGRYRTRQRKFTVSDAIKTGVAEKLFDFLADCIAQFLAEEPSSSKSKHHMGFTFSFPVKQTGLASGTLVTWTKGFSASGVEGADVVKMLSDAIARKGLAVEVGALANDTVGTLLTQAYQDADCYVAVILGTGTNAAYVEKTAAIPKWKGPNSTGEMIINMEWGGFDSTERKILPLTQFDRALDRESAHPTQQIYEKMISGMYLGEITRLVLTQLSADGVLFEGMTSKQMETPYAFDTALMSRIERDHSADLRDARNVLEELMGIPRTSYGDRKVVKRVCELVGIRAARLAAVGVAGVITKMNRTSGCTVAVDGSVFEHYPHFANRMRDALQELFGISAESIRMVATRDGSGVGAGLLALLASQGMQSGSKHQRQESL